MDRVLTPEAQSRKLVNLNTSLRGCATIVEGAGGFSPTDDFKNYYNQFKAQQCSSLLDE